MFKRFALSLLLAGKLGTIALVALGAVATGLYVANYNSTVPAVGTSALRDAGNAKRFIKTVKRESGLDVDVISAREEARPAISASL